MNQMFREYTDLMQINKRYSLKHSMNVFTTLKNKLINSDQRVKSAEEKLELLESELIISANRLKEAREAKVMMEIECKKLYPLI